MLKLKSLTIKNFLSIGNITQSINFESNDLTLVSGENLDLGGNDNRNGVGKSSIINALSYALFGESLTRIKKDNLINASNLKNMLVALNFEVNGKTYTIERGRKPNVFRFSEDGVSNNVNITKKEDESQGENRHTQEEIIKLISLTHDMFKHIVALNTYVEPFLSLKAGDQRVIIEQLLGITKLSEKADKLREELKTTKDEIKEEEYKIAAAVRANKSIEENISLLVKKSNKWDLDKETKIETLQSAILEYIDVDIDKEIVKHQTNSESIKISTELKSLKRELSDIDTNIASLNNAIAKLKKAIDTSTEKQCPTCLQAMDVDTHKKVHYSYKLQLEDNENKLNIKISEKNNVVELINQLEPHFIGTEKTFYSSINEAYNHKTTLSTLGNKLENELSLTNPYIDQIDSLKNNGLQVIDYTKLNVLTENSNHQEFLLKLLTSKDSFIRKGIIDQNLTYLNSRLSHYLIELGLPHQVKFKSDLDVEITMYGREFDFDNLSRGERTRLILSLSFSFRDIYELINNKINLLFIDELLDNGLDTSGVESSLSTLKKMSKDNNRNIFLISHRDELIGRIPNVLKVIKDGGYTTIESTSS